MSKHANEEETGGGQTSAATHEPHPLIVEDFELHGSGTAQPQASQPAAATASGARGAGPQGAGRSGRETTLQDHFLNALRREAIDCTLHLCDGSQERGRVRAFDNFTVLLESASGAGCQLVYKHAITRIVAGREPLSLWRA